MGLLLCLSSYALAILAAAIVVLSLPFPGGVRTIDSLRDLWALRGSIGLFAAVFSLIAYAGARAHQQWLSGHLWLALSSGLIAAVLTAGCFVAGAGVMSLIPPVFPEWLTLVAVACMEILTILIPALAMNAMLRFFRRRIAATPDGG
jgi:hypothetical protein